MNESTVTIDRTEYDELIIKAWKYDTLRDRAKKSNYLTEAELTLFELKDGDSNA